MGCGASSSHTGRPIGESLSSRTSRASSLPSSKFDKSSITKSEPSFNAKSLGSGFGTKSILKGSKNYNLSAQLSAASGTSMAQLDRTQLLGRGEEGVAWREDSEAGTLKIPSSTSPLKKCTSIRILIDGKEDLIVPGTPDADEDDQGRRKESSDPSSKSSLSKRKKSKWPGEKLQSDGRLLRERGGAHGSKGSSRPKGSNSVPAASGKPAACKLPAKSLSDLADLTHI